MPSEQVKTEAFGPALGAVPPPGFTEVAEIRPVAGATAAAGTPPLDASAIGPATASLRFSKSDKVAPLPARQERARGRPNPLAFRSTIPVVSGSAAFARPSFWKAM